ncbi:MAG: hypothetical protein CME70_03740 [Halobacteriovorax sp.]|nr:hypothetical protein [Halobacteriovorax sp.]|tara:strand:- start:181035 stop:181814 length:780 start_codon:yes stop_codon:yes gene_type:complete
MSEDIKIHKFYLDYEGEKTNALAFIPSAKKPSAKALAVFSHGYSSHKGSILNWPTRLAEEGMPSVIFDLPGHYLGNFSEVKDFEKFKSASPELFIKAHEELKVLSGQSPESVVLGGHSMGAMLAMMSSNLGYFDNLKTTLLCVGLGRLPVGAKHLFNSPFYKSTLNLRAQLVCDELHPEKVFPWINEVKTNIVLSNKRIHFITGADDVVVGEGGSERMADELTKQGNTVTLDKPVKLPHHLPEQAAGFIKKFLKSEKLF